MRAAISMLLLVSAMQVLPQDGATETSPPLVITDATAVQLSKSQVFQAALDAWTYSFGQEPGVKVITRDTVAGRIEATARVNYRSQGLGSREQTMGVINYTITIQAENGQCQVRISHLYHVGNRNAPGGGIDLGTIYSGPRPLERTQGISAGTAQRLHEDMREQATARIKEVMKRFSSDMRMSAEQMR